MLRLMGWGLTASGGGVMGAVASGCVRVGAWVWVVDGSCGERVLGSVVGVEATRVLVRYGAGGGARWEPIETVDAVDADEAPEAEAEPTEEEVWSMLGKARQERGLTQAEAGHLVGVGQTTWARWEGRTRAIPLRQVEAVAVAMGLDPEVLRLWCGVFGARWVALARSAPRTLLKVLRELEGVGDEDDT